MEDEILKQKLQKEIEKIEKMINEGEDRTKIEIERRKLDEMLEEYTKHI